MISVPIAIGIKISEIWFAQNLLVQSRNSLFFQAAKTNIMTNRLALALLCLLPGVSLFSQPRQEAKALLLQSIQLLDAGDYQASREAANTALTKIEKEETLRAELHFQLARVELEFGNYATADSLTDLAVKAFKKPHPSHAPALALKAYSLVQQAKYRAADSLLSLAASMQEKLPGRNHHDFARTLDWMGLSRFEQRKLEEAESFYLDAKAMRAANPGKLSLDYALSLDHLGELYVETERFDEAKTILEEGFQIVSRHPFRCRLLNNLGRVYLARREHEQAEKYFRESLNIQKQAGLDKHPHYGKTLGNLGWRYSILGNFEDALPFYREGLQVLLKSLGAAHPDYAVSLNNFANLNENLGNYEEAGRDYNKASEIFYRNKAFDYYSVAKHNSALIFKYAEKYDTAISVFEELIHSFNAGELTNNEYLHAMTLKNLAESLRYGEYADRYAEADSLIRLAANTFKKVYSENHSLYLDLTSPLAEISELQGKIEVAKDVYIQNCHLLIELLQRYYPSLGEDERLLFFSETIDYHSVFIYSFAKRHANRFPDLNRAILDLRIASKGASLQTGLSNRLAALTLNDPDLEKLSNEYRESANELARILFQSETINPDRVKKLQLLRTDIRNLEGKMSQMSRNLKSLFEQENAPRKDYEALRQALGEHQALIDFVHLPYYDPFEQKMAADTLLGAFICRRTYDAPIFDMLGATQEEVKETIRQEPGEPSSYVHHHALSYHLFSKIWSPLERHLSGIKQVFLCPEGALHGLAFHALHFDSLNRAVLAEKYDIRYRLSPGDFLIPNREKISDKTIALIGGALFDSLGMQTKDTMNYASRGIHFQYLKGTKAEILRINELSKIVGWKADVFTETEASEQNFRKLSGKKAPHILHIATHGFFLNPGRGSIAPKRAKITVEDLLRNSSNPLFRSGLVLSGANYAWKSQQSDATEADGILTAYEIAGLNFWKTDLVVLSACETGKGVVFAQEGAFGLQRAFRQAGARSLIVSLWKIPDEQTVELMDIFYSHLFQGDLTVVALRKAQLEMSEKYNPYYWAAFVLVE